MAKEADMRQYDYARTALKEGVQLTGRLGANGDNFGMIGSTPITV